MPKCLLVYLGSRFEYFSEREREIVEEKMKLSVSAYLCGVSESVYMRACVYVFFGHTDTHTYTQTQTDPHTYIQIHIHTQTHTHYIQIHVHTYTHIIQIRI